MKTSLTAIQENKIKRKVHTELKDMVFDGYCGDSEWLQYDYQTFKNYCAGRLVISIGEGDFKSEVNTVIRLSIAWGKYQECFHKRLEQLGFKSA